MLLWTTLSIISGVLRKEYLQVDIMFLTRMFADDTIAVSLMLLKPGVSRMKLLCMTNSALRQEKVLEVRNGVITWHAAQKPKWVSKLYEALFRV